MIESMEQKLNESSHRLTCLKFLTCMMLIFLPAACGNGNGGEDADAGADIEVDQTEDISIEPSPDADVRDTIPDVMDVPLPDGDATDADVEPDGISLIFPDEDWEVSDPEDQDVDSVKLDEAMEYLEAECEDHGVTQAVVIRNGYMIWQGDDIDNRHNVWSCTKSYTSTILGLLVDDSACTVDTLAHEYVSDISDLYDTVRLHHFATMTSGYDAVGGGQSNTPFDPTTPIFAPGEEFLYWDSAMNQFGNTLTRIAGESMEELFKRRIANPIGMVSDDWDWGDWGDVDGMLVNGGAGNKGKGIHITARQMARFGLLFLSRGNWDGNQLISSEWVDQATSVQVPFSIPPHEPGGVTGVYGYNWRVNGVTSSGERLWPLAPDGAYMASGHNGNYCVIIPEWQMVIVRLGVDGTRIVADQWSTFLDLVEEALL